MVDTGQKQLIRDSDFCVGVIGHAGEFILIPLKSGTAEIDLAMAEGECRGFAYCGLLAVTKTGHAGVRCNPENPDAIYTMCFAGMEFARQVADMLRPKPAHDGVSWLEALHALPDPRPA
jgi:hypothetical protein